jgi:hypothetical protein
MVSFYVLEFSPTAFSERRQSLPDQQPIYAVCVALQYVVYGLFHHV